MHVFLWLLMRLALGGVWVIAGLAKLANREAAADAVSQFELLPERWSAAFGRALPFLELTLGGLLLVGGFTRAAALASVGLLAVFTVAILVTLAGGRRVECNCFGQLGSARVTWRTVVRNVVLLGTAVALGWRSPLYLSLDGWVRGQSVVAGEPHPVEFLPVFVAITSLLLIGSIVTCVWETARVVAQAEDGPAVGSAEWSWLRSQPMFRPHEEQS